MNWSSESFQGYESFELHLISCCPGACQHLVHKCGQQTIVNFLNASLTHSPSLKGRQDYCENKLENTQTQDSQQRPAPGHAGSGINVALEQGGPQEQQHNQTVSLGRTTLVSTLLHCALLCMAQSREATVQA